MKSLLLPEQDQRSRDEELDRVFKEIEFSIEVGNRREALDALETVERYAAEAKDAEALIRVGRLAELIEDQSMPTEFRVQAWASSLHKRAWKEAEPFAPTGQTLRNAIVIHGFLLLLFIGWGSVPLTLAGRYLFGSLDGGTFVCWAIGGLLWLASLGLIIARSRRYREPLKPLVITSFAWFLIAMLWVPALALLNERVRRSVGLVRGPREEVETADERGAGLSPYRDLSTAVLKSHHKASEGGDLATALLVHIGAALALLIPLVLIIVAVHPIDPNGISIGVIGGLYVGSWLAGLALIIWRWLDFGDGFDRLWHATAGFAVVVFLPPALLGLFSGRVREWVGLRPWPW